MSEKSKIAAERVSKQVKRKRKKETSSGASPKVAKLVRHPESDSDYVPSDEEEEETVVIRKQRKSVSAKFEKVKDDGSIACYKARLELYYKRLEEERCILNRDDCEEFHVLKGGLKVPAGVWSNLYRFVCFFFFETIAGFT